MFNKSQYRQKPFCNVFKTCGGCTGQSISYEMQLSLKNKLVENLLKKQGVKYSKINSTIGMGMTYYYRNKVQYPTRQDENGNNKIGFYSSRTHQIVENDCCYIQNRTIDILSKSLFEDLVKNGFSMYSDETKKGDIKHLLISFIRCKLVIKRIIVIHLI